MPTAENATQNSELVLKDGQEHGDLMMAKSSVTLTAEETNSFVLEMQRCVLMLQSVRLEKIPSDVTAISVTLSRSYKGITMEGEMKTANVEEVALTKSVDEPGVWTLTSSRLLLLSSSGATIKVSMTRNGDRRGYIYQLDANKLKSNYKYDVTGYYTEKQELELSGTIKGTSWAGTESIIFEFDESNAEGGNSGGDTGDTDITEGTAPAEGTLYQDRYYVLSRVDHDATTTVLLLHYDEQEGVLNKNMSADEVKTAVDAALAELSAASDIRGWRLPNSEEELDAFYLHITDLNGLSSKLSKKVAIDDFYAYDVDGEVRFFMPSSTGVRDRQVSMTAGTLYLRPVVTLTFAKQ